MSLLIQGMEMPKENTILWLYPDGNVRVWRQDIDHDEWKTAIELPTPHGRLIDADALIADLKRQCKEVFRIDAVSPDDFWITRNEAYNEHLWTTWCESLYDYINAAPTIIPAEEGGT